MLIEHITFNIILFHKFTLHNNIFQWFSMEENLLLFSTASRRLEREYQLFMLKAGVYSPSVSTNLGEDYKAKNKLFVERIEDIISNHSSEYGFQYPSAVNQIPSDYVIESGKQTEATNGKKISFDSFTDKIKEKVTEKSIKEGSAVPWEERLQEETIKQKILIQLKEKYET